MGFPTTASGAAPLRRNSLLQSKVLVTQTEDSKFPSAVQVETSRYGATPFRNSRVLYVILCNSNILSGCCRLTPPSMAAAVSETPLRRACLTRSCLTVLWKCQTPRAVIIASLRARRATFASTMTNCRSAILPDFSQ